MDQTEEEMHRATEAMHQTAERRAAENEQSLEQRVW